MAGSRRPSRPSVAQGSVTNRASSRRSRHRPCRTAPDHQGLEGRLVRHTLPNRRVGRMVLQGIPVIRRNTRNTRNPGLGRLPRCPQRGAMKLHASPGKPREKPPDPRPARRLPTVALVRLALVRKPASGEPRRLATTLAPPRHHRDHGEGSLRPLVQAEGPQRPAHLHGRARRTTARVPATRKG